MFSIRNSSFVFSSWKFSIIIINLLWDLYYLDTTFPILSSFSLRFSFDFISLCVFCYDIASWSFSSLIYSLPLSVLYLSGRLSFFLSFIHLFLVHFSMLFNCYIYFYPWNCSWFLLSDFLFLFHCFIFFKLFEYIYYDYFKALVSPFLLHLVNTIFVHILADVLMFPWGSAVTAVICTSERLNTGLQSHHKEEMSSVEIDTWQK